MKKESPEPAYGEHHAEMEGDTPELAHLFYEYREGNTKIGNEKTDWRDAEWVKQNRQRFYHLERTIAQSLRNAGISMISESKTKTVLGFPKDHKQDAQSVACSLLYKTCEGYGLIEKDVDDIIKTDDLTLEEIVEAFVTRLTEKASN